ncbi:hypothetical protein FOB58_000932 [Candida parapsilosis]|uniref:Kinesin motor domain-containing protein n=2 Tax=Candida parapsilosis TaxID=5480 RepID=G8BG58_CANPC|nr:uncharacterized protein CPAR2_204850 [Candida parapsilosis]KAF6055010.1 hypothetical protein FOB58_000932 [Candida parapsilosis]KAF6055967.1 hypothetical protein FOB59_000479 [Candida parapsilosis]KAF6058897.1 hypothetical protein FOB60_000479 [Candida parapsilosis]KAF6067654.1 hypothetical protein FOB61_000479 [Candida parapsilosis]KAI5908597.1 hypothetical protein K4G61_g2284 [Candida parapsilosis]
MSVPLYLKIKGPQSGDQHYDPRFAVISEKSIEFNDSKYDFEQIYQPSETQYPDLVNSHNSCIVLMGPTGGGKTTMMRQLVNAKLKSFDSEPVFVSSFEIANNKFLIDLLDNNPAKVPFSLLNNFENKLKRRKASSEMIKEIFKQRSSKATEFNPNSSRSCLVITFFYHNFRTTFVDLMGNEKNSKLSSNIFANTNMSSITQQMVNKQKDIRSHNVVTNYIFKNRDLKVVLNLDPNGDVSLIKSTLTNIAEIVKTFKLSTTAVEKSSRVPSYTLPTVSSIKGSPPKVAKKVGSVRLTQPVRPTRVVDRKYAIRKPPVPTRGPSKEAKIIESLKKDQIISRQKYAESIADIKTEIGCFKQETNQMVNSYQNLRSRLDLLAQVNADKQEMIAAIQEENSKLVQELNQVKQEEADYVQVISTHKEEADRHQVDLTNLQKELEVSKNALSELKSLKTNLENEVELSKEEGRKLIERVRMLNFELDENKKLLASNSFDMTQLREEIDSQKSLSVQKESQVIELQNTKDELVKRNEVLERELRDSKLSLEEATLGNNEVSNEVSKLSALIVEKDAEIERLHQVEQEVSQLKETHQFESESAASQLSKMKADISAKQIKIDYLHTTETNLTQQVHQLQDEKKVLEGKVNELKLANEELQKQIASAVDTNNGRAGELESELSETKNQLKALSQKLEKESSLNSQLRFDLEAAIAKQQTLEFDLANAESSLSKESNEKEDLTNKLASKTQQLKTKIEAATQLEMELNDSKEQYKQLHERFARKQEHYKNKISDLKKSHELVIAEKDAEIKKLRSSPTKLGLSDDYNGHLFSERSSPFGFNPNEIYNDSVVESTINLNQADQTNVNNSNNHNNENNENKSSEKKSPKKSYKLEKQKSRSSTPNKHTPTKNVLQPSNQFNSVPLSSSKIKKKSGSNKSSPLKSIKA